MALQVCLDCTTAYAVGAPQCPQCGSTSWAEDGTEEAEMAKISKHGGPTTAPVAGAAAAEVVESEGSVAEAIADGEVTAEEVAAAEVEDTTEAEETAEADVEPVEIPDDVRTGSVAYMLSWVADDADRARAVLDLEQSQDSPRVTLVSGLEKVIADAEAGE